MIVKIFPPKIAKLSSITFTMFKTAEAIKIIITFINIPITAMIIVIIRAHGLALSNPYAIKK